MSEPRSRFFHEMQQQGRPLLPQVVLRSGLGDRVWGFVNPDVNTPIGTEGSSDRRGDVFFAQEEFTSQPVLERAARLVALQPLNESTQPLDQDILGAWGQGQRTVLEFEVENGDRAMTRMLGEEYVLNKEVYLFVGFPGLPWDYSQQRYKGTVTRLTLTKNSLKVEAETLC